MSTATPDVSGTVFDEETLHVAKVYAEALVNAASKTGDAESVVSELEEVDADLIRPNPQFAAILASISVPSAEKSRILLSILQGRALPTVVRFIEVLGNHGRLELISPIAQEARALWDKRQNRRPVLVKSAVSLDDGQKDALTVRVAAMINATPIMKYDLDPSLIGGFVVQVGDDLYDASVKTKLDRLRHGLLAGKTRDLASSQSLIV